ncbi:hypothetical protein BASA50_001235 [Batrachochytrium salamandrivorans]|uniref:GPI transamidase component PIG-S n=1 Tax=Batrachochytrium salamandrivorans TaxID=1357716 RepID=A0ABQ8ESJ7_9FUNG|nr:hypothetical protein BASA62_009789 [Batrachochytrium salamandrivorans]KAH6583936.1 hypothetical protein BASA60_001161 [Batrachochytrium salamandrivorans]KAH6584479.1 hypothetical protein BASA61_007436 [Batrachochytrium salamandrivorans]KAH6585627.1 hypothetical protein BASA50_001235 [Batrachochytrium salamandrivorans]KAH9252881.1 hypothetical protein BASA81_009184 [Batrachochytrium salamandrivorans]
MKVELERITTEQFLARRSHIVFVIWTVIVLAIPVWWKTTEVYRAPLPFDAIRSWETAEALTVKLSMNIHLCFGAKVVEKLSPTSLSTVATLTQMELAEIFAEAVPAHSDVRQVSLMFEVDSIVGPNAWEASVMSPQEFDAGLGNTHGDNGVYYVYIDCAVAALTGKESVYIGKNRAIFLNMHQMCTRDSVVSRAVSVLSGLFGREQLSLSKLYKEKAADDMDRKSMRVVKYAPTYQVMLSLLIGNPEDTIVSWDIHTAAEAYIQSFLAELGTISDFTISSQILNYASLPIKPESYNNSNGSTEYHMSPKSLSNFVNSVEWNLASVVSSASPIHMILYIPPFEQTPLFVLHSDGSTLESNAFLIPQWGGVVIRNLPTDTHRVHLSMDDLHPVMEIFVEQLRGLLGMDRTQIMNEHILLPGVTVQYAAAPELGVTLWELDRLFRGRTLQNIVNAAQTLTSLANLLEQLSGMVVLDLIKDLVTNSLWSLTKAKHELQNRQFIKAAHHACEAVATAEAAFFHPSMVPLLYFPDEHKFAIYMPYFVPVAVPLIMALIREVRLRIKARGLGGIKTKTA